MTKVAFRKEVVSVTGRHRFLRSSGHKKVYIDYESIFVQKEKDIFVYVYIHISIHIHISIYRKKPERLISTCL